MEQTIVVAEPQPRSRLGGIALPGAVRRDRHRLNISATTSRGALMIYDDLSKHAVAYRQMSAAPAPAPPGRERPTRGTCSYLHSQAAGAGRLS